MIAPLFTEPSRKTLATTGRVPETSVRLLESTTKRWPMISMRRSQVKTVRPGFFGLRPGYAYETWCAAIASILLGQYDDIKSGAKTLEAEHGLGIPASWYWYVARSDESFGQGVFSCGAHDIAWEPTECGVSPFDTGGLWHRHIKTHDDKTNGELRTLFQNNNRPLSNGQCYREHLSTNYLTVADYVLGVPPSAGTEGIICTQPPNHPRAWTWEARVERKES